MKSKAEVIKIDINDLKDDSVFPYCRELMKEGKVNPKSPIEVYRGENISYTVSSVAEGAKLTVIENDRVGPYFSKYKPFPQKLRK